MDRALSELMNLQGFCSRCLKSISISNPISHLDNLYILKESIKCSWCGNEVNYIYSILPKGISTPRTIANSTYFSVGGKPHYLITVDDKNYFSVGGNDIITIDYPSENGKLIGNKVDYPSVGGKIIAKVIYSLDEGSPKAKILYPTESDKLIAKIEYSSGAGKPTVKRIEYPY